MSMTSKESRMVTRCVHGLLASSDVAARKRGLEALAGYLRLRRRELARDADRELPVAEIDGVPVYLSDFTEGRDIRHVLEARLRYRMELEAQGALDDPDCDARLLEGLRGYERALQASRPYEAADPERNPED